MESNLFDNIVLSINMDYSIKFNGSEREPISDSFIKAYLSYNMK